MTVKILKAATNQKEAKNITHRPSVRLQHHSAVMRASDHLFLNCVLVISRTVPPLFSFCEVLSPLHSLISISASWIFFGSFLCPVSPFYRLVSAAIHL